MQTLKDLIKEVFRDKLYEATVVLRSDRSKNLTVVTDNLRGVCGITTTTVIEPAKPVSETVERTILKVKFFVLEPTLKEHVKRMLSKVPRARFLKLNELSSMVCWLSSEENSFSTAAVFDISGGRSTY